MRDAFGQVDRVLLLGGGSQIAVAIATALVRERGAREVVLAARRPNELDDEVAALEEAGATVHTVAFDLLDHDRHEAFVAEVAEAHGDLDVVVLAGGVLGDQFEVEEDPAKLRLVLETNFVGAAGVLMAVARRLQAQGTGSVVVLSSIAATQARRSNFAYGASKAGLDAFARGVSDMLDGSGARALVVRPGFVRTKMTDGMEEAPFSQDAEEVASAVLAALDRGRDVVYSSAGVGAVAKVLQTLPRPVLRRLPR